MNLVADLHLHSTVSDGTLSPAELMRRAAEAGLRTAALTDHDNLDGLGEAAEAAASLGIRFIPGVELSCGGGKEIHVLGYGYDPNHAELASFCREKQQERFVRTARMVEQLAENGVRVAYDRVLEIACGVPGRPHVGRAIVEAGYAGSLKEAFSHFLDPGRCGYVAKKDTPVAEGVRLLHRAGGVAVLAHPMQLKKSHAALDSLIGEWAKAGLDGIEVYHPSADAGDIPALLRIAERLDLLVTGGSDFHGREVKPDVAIGQGLERWRTAEKDVLLLTERIRQRQGQRSCYHTENME